MNTSLAIAVTLAFAAGPPAATPAFPSQIPPAFERNVGQYASEIAYRARAAGYDLLLTNQGAYVATSSGNDRGLLRMTFLESNPAPVITAIDQRPGVVNHFIGSDPRRWHAGVASFGRVAYSDVYPGVDLVFYPSDDAIEYDLIVAPGVSPDSITLCIDGAESMRIEENGDLALQTTGGEVRFRHPVVYQEKGTEQILVDARYALAGQREVKFEVGEFDVNEPLVIDPLVVRYSSLLGGAGSDNAFGVAVDGDRNVYVTGNTTSSDFLLSGGAVQSSPGGGGDIFVTKLSADGTRVIYSTYLGGSRFEDGWGDIDVDAAGNAYITGTTQSRDFPVTETAFQRQFGGGPDDAYVVKLSADGTRLLYSTYLGGSNEDQGRAIAVDRLGSAYLTGRTKSADFPTRNAFQALHGGDVDAFVTKLAPDGSAIVYSSLLGGSDIEVGRDIAVDAAGSAYIAGRTLSANFPATPGAFQTSFGGRGAAGQGDGIAAKLAPDGSLVFASFLGGSGGEIAAGIAVDLAGNAYVSGLTESTNFPTTTNAYQPRFAGGPADAFLTKLDSLGATAIYSTFFGGAEGDEEIFSVAVDARGNAYATGVTFSRSFPTMHPFQVAHGGAENDSFIAKFDPSGSRLIYSTFLGGAGREGGFRVTVDNGGNAYAVGFTASSNFLVTEGAVGTRHAGGGDAWITSVAFAEDAPGELDARIVPVVGSTAGAAGSFFRTSFQLHNPRNAVVSGSVLFRPAGSGTPTASPMTYMIPPFQTIAFTDLLPVMGEVGIGSADLVFAPGEEPIVVARIFQDGGDAGTSGMSQSALPLEAALDEHQSGVLIAPLDPVAARLNIGMRALGSGATIRFTRRNASGTLIGSVQRMLDSNVFIQVAATELFDDQLQANDTIAVDIVTGNAIVYGATNDNRTHDPSLQFARFRPSVERERRVIPVVGSVRGAFGSLFKTSFQLHNPSDSELHGRARFHPAEASTAENDRILEYTLAPRETIAFEDLPRSMGVGGLGTMDLESITGPLPVSLVRIYNDLGELGTRGMSEDQILEQDALGAGSTGVLVAPPDAARARFNVGIRTLESGAELAVKVYDRAGVVMRETTLSYPPRYFVQTSASALLGIALDGSDAIHVTVRSGSIIVYGSTTDNTTNDPSMQIARALGS